MGKFIVKLVLKGMSLITRLLVPLSRPLNALLPIASVSWVPLFLISSVRDLVFVSEFLLIYRILFMRLSCCSLLLFFSSVSLCSLACSRSAL